MSQLLTRARPTDGQSHVTTHHLYPSEQAPDESDSDVDFVLDGEPPKDETEQELERLVFGDAAGVLDGINNFGQAIGEEDADLGRKDQEQLIALNDAELFFVDVDPSGDSLARSALQALPSQPFVSRIRAWEDSDDERMVVSLATAPRLRKLRRTVEEDEVNGQEYSMRLRQQFELLNPPPEWATYARTQPSRKKRRLSGPENDSDVDMSDNSDASSDLNGVSAQPLAALLRNASSLIKASESGRPKKRKLKPGAVQIQRSPDIGTAQPSSVTSLAFHPTYPFVLSSGPSSTIYLHQLARSPPAVANNPLLVSLHVTGAPLTTTAFHPTDSRIFLSSRKKYFHIWDLDSGQVEKIARVAGHEHDQPTMERFKISPDGQYIAFLGSARRGSGVINILSAATMQWKAQARVESRGGVADFYWWRNSSGITIAAKSGEVTEWSVNEQKVMARWQDEGAVGTTVLALGGSHELVKSAIGTDRWVAIGSSSGIVNIYDRRALLIDHKTNSEHVFPAAPKPHKVLDHLTTAISHLAFSPDGQLLAMASQHKRDALRLVHLPSATVFRNWPTDSTSLGRISAVAFADGSVVDQDIHSMLAVGNEQGKIRTWDIM